VAPNGTLGYDVFISEPIPIAVDPPLTTDQAASVGDWIKSSRKNVTHIVATHGHGDHWFTAGVLADRFDARIVASRGTIEQMHNNLAGRGAVWDQAYPGQIPPSPERYPNRQLGATILWAGAQALYAIRDGHDTISAVIGGWLH